jgi:hypothetical protein
LKASKAAKEAKDNQDANNDTTPRVDWNGDAVPAGPWYDNKLFSVGDFEVTGKTAAIGTGAIVAIIVVSCAVCSFISYRERKSIKIQA